MLNQSKPTSLYLHVPFCKSICAYCDFCHTVYNKDNANKWLDALKKEIQSKDINLNLKTIYIGGGTPSSLDDELLDSVLSLLDSYSSNVLEYTVEVNPETVTQEKVSILKKHGVNRISMGLQSSNINLLKLMNRHHTLEDVRNAMFLFESQGITNISLDLMYSLPTQTIYDWKKSLEDCVSLMPKHISIYSLTIEENSVFGKKGYESLDEDIEADMYVYAISYLESKGYKQYEISNFCLESYESKHNLAYWKYDDFYGISTGASGKENDIRYDNVSNLKRYLGSPLEREEINLTKEDLIFENIMMSLRLKNGFDIEEFNKKYSIDVLEMYTKPIQSNIQKGTLEIKNGYLRCTSNGYPILNTILVDFLD